MKKKNNRVASIMYTFELFMIMVQTQILLESVEK